MKHIDLQETLPHILKEWRNVGAVVEEPIYDLKIAGKMNPRQEDAYIPWETIIQIRDQLPYGKEKLLISMYTMLDPVRNDYYQVRIFNEPPQSNYDGSYIVLGNTNQITIKDYKTTDTYGTKILDIPPKLLYQIKLSLERDPRDYLFQSDTGALYTRVHGNKVFNTMLKRTLKNKGFSLTMFRNSYLSYLKVDQLPIDQRKQIANNMGHSCLRQKVYEFRDQPK